MSQTKNVQFWQQLTQQYHPENFARHREVAEEELNALIKNAKSKTKNSSPTPDVTENAADVTMEEESKSDDGLDFLNSDRIEPASRRDMVSNLFEKNNSFYSTKLSRNFFMGSHNQLHAE